MTRGLARCDRPLLARLGQRGGRNHFLAPLLGVYLLGDRMVVKYLLKKPLYDFEMRRAFGAR